MFLMGDGLPNAWLSTVAVSSRVLGGVFGGRVFGGRVFGGRLWSISFPMRGIRSMAGCWEGDGPARRESQSALG